MKPLHDQLHILAIKLDDMAETSDNIETELVFVGLASLAWKAFETYTLEKQQKEA